MPDIYKMVNATQLDSDLTDIADSIRTRTGDSSLLAFPTDFITEISTLGQPPQTPTDSILFFSYNPFTLGVYNKTKNWDGTLYHSTDRDTWSEWDGSTDITAPEVNNWYVIYLKGENVSYLNTTANENGRFVVTGSAVKCVGNMRNVLSVTSTGDKLAAGAFRYLFYNCITVDFDIELPYAKMNSGCYTHMFFGCSSLTKAPALPSTDLSTLSDCYSYMFANCVSLTTAPALPAMTLTSSCYSHMFEGCTSLKNAPQLPATTTAENCYSFMFSGCTSLETAPNLPATTITGTYAYNSMFSGCKSLINPPVISATTLNGSCYMSMFSGCTSLTSAPALPAMSLATYCYKEMFNGCTSLTSAPALPATTLTNECYHSMFKGCTALTSVPALPAAELKDGCYREMFYYCTNLASLPELPAITLKTYCYYQMFYLCSKIKMSSTQTGDYQTEFRIPSSGNGATASSALNNMFTATGGTFTGTPMINVSFYTSNTVIPVPTT